MHDEKTCVSDECMTCLVADVHRVEEKIDTVITILEKADKVIDTIGKEVKPTLEALSSHPMLKMFLTKKGK